MKNSSMFDIKEDDEGILIQKIKSFKVKFMKQIESHSMQISGQELKTHISQESLQKYSQEQSSYKSPKKYQNKKGSNSSKQSVLNYSDGSKQEFNTLKLKKLQINGNIIQGTWKDDRLHGLAKIKYNSGEYFQGFFYKGFKTEGLIKFVDGLQYQGTFSNNLFHGLGMLRDSAGRQIIAYWHKGSIKGEVTIKYPTGEVYKGKIKNLKKHGRGKLWLKDQYSYEGQFANGKIQGYGKYLKKDEVIAEGNWEDGILLRKNTDIFSRWLQNIIFMIFYPRQDRQFWND